MIPSSSSNSTNLNYVVAFNEGKRLLTMSMLARSGLILSRFSNFSTYVSAILNCLDFMWLTSISEVQSDGFFQKCCAELWVTYFLGKKKKLPFVSHWTRWQVSSNIFHVAWCFFPSKVNPFRFSTWNSSRRRLRSRSGLSSFAWRSSSGGVFADK